MLNKIQFLLDKQIKGTQTTIEIEMDIKRAREFAARMINQFLWFSLLVFRTIL